MTHTPPQAQFPDHSRDVPEDVLDVIERAHWQTARTVEHVEGGQHQYNVIGWNKDDLTDAEFWSIVQAIRDHGRREIWMPPEGFYDDPSKRKPMRNTYLYVGDYAYWYTKPWRGVPMLNREHRDIQERTKTRTPVEVGKQLSFAELIAKQAS